MITKTIVVTRKNGIHARPASQFVKVATSFESEVTVIKNGKSGNGKSIMGIMAMAIASGEEIILSTSGVDEEQAMEALENVLTELED